jgi:hypothetical protein
MVDNVAYFMAMGAADPEDVVKEVTILEFIEGKWGGTCAKVRENSTGKHWFAVMADLFSTPEAASDQRVEYLELEIGRLTSLLKGLKGKP